MLKELIVFLVVCALLDKTLGQGLGGGGGVDLVPEIAKNTPPPSINCILCNHYGFNSEIPALEKAFQYYEPAEWCDRGINDTLVPDYNISPCIACGRAHTIFRLVLFDGRTVDVSWISRQCLDFLLSFIPPGGCMSLIEMPADLQHSVSSHLAIYRKLGFAAVELQDVQFCVCTNDRCNGQLMDMSSDMLADFSMDVAGSNSNRHLDSPLCYIGGLIYIIYSFARY